MPKEVSVHVDKFTLNPTDIFYSPQGYLLNEYGIACQAILVRQSAIAASLNNSTPHIIKTLNQEIEEIRKEHDIPEEALPFLKGNFGNAVKRQESALQGVSPNMQVGVLARI